MVSFSLLLHDVPGLLSRVTKIIYEMGINIVDLYVSPQQDTTTRFSVTLEIPDDDASILERLIDRIRLHIPEFLVKEDDFFDKKK